MCFLANSYLKIFSAEGPAITELISCVKWKGGYNTDQFDGSRCTMVHQDMLYKYKRCKKSQLKLTSSLTRKVQEPTSPPEQEEEEGAVQMQRLGVFSSRLVSGVWCLVYIVWPAGVLLLQ